MLSAPPSLHPAQQSSPWVQAQSIELAWFGPCSQVAVCFLFCRGKHKPVDVVVFGFSTKASTRRLYWIVHTDLAPVASYVACDEAM